MLKITIQNQTFKVKTKKVESNSNYNLSAQIFKGDEKSPIIGTILREGNNPKDVEFWATNQICSYLNVSLERYLVQCKHETFPEFCSRIKAELGETLYAICNPQKHKNNLISISIKEGTRNRIIAAVRNYCGTEFLNYSTTL